MLDEATLHQGVEDVAELVRPDGGDLELASFDAESGSVTLRLILEGANCAECVLPRPMLEEVAVGVLRRAAPAVTSLTIEDPREHEPA
jgi:Fe-S cluster biogenesis protein NfuA